MDKYGWIVLKGLKMVRNDWKCIEILEWLEMAGHGW